MEQFEFLILLLAAIVGLEVLARRLHLPPAAAFILGGGALALMPGIGMPDVDPDLILVIFLPPLLMSGAYMTVWRDFRQNLRGILLLAVGAVIFTTMVVGVGVKWLLPGLPWAVCFALGAIVSPPDAVAANAVLARVSLPSRITVLLQGESLLNDAAGLVLFRFAIVAALTGTFSLSGALTSFLVLSVGGVALGVVIAYAGLLAIRWLRGHGEAVVTVTLLMGAISYIGGEKLHVSGVLSTVTTGLIVGWRQHEVFSADTRMRAHAVWGILVFLLESVLFMFIGLSLRGVLGRLEDQGDAVQAFLLPCLLVVALVVVCRFVWLYAVDGVYSLIRLVGFRNGPAPSLAASTIMGWAGMRGVVSLVAALSVPETMPGRDFILIATFLVILVTVLVQGTTLEPLIRLLRLSGAEELKMKRHSEDRAWARMTAAQYRAIQKASHTPDGQERHPRLLEQYAHRASVASIYAKNPEEHRPHEIAHFMAILEAIKAGRQEVLRLHRAGEITDGVLRDMEKELDLQQLVAEARVSKDGEELILPA
ncbi:Na+/H+ antiporter nhaP [Granulibacter bethesdensis]|uniref:Na+/H+ antiporter nhaP n=1 Tax=Granulibacter bethesdensis TaxID=364410 RepID=A0AAC9K6C7_9PROT|nr:Na+/H+ antiporter [Granulibacter bethesdensis]APH53761.1 Na+/H+ antiporter nhaP [Granulibacter bethesdensis]APH61340.1 Na+/H+ antiporter nhaP [Granulibacter bethesdensis]